jgi:hypothetical protein
MRGWDDKKQPKTAADLDRDIAEFMQKPKHAKQRAKRVALFDRGIIKKKTWC